MQTHFFLIVPLNIFFQKRLKIANQKCLKKRGKTLKLTIEATPNENAALVLVVQERQRELDFIKGRLH